MSDGEEADTVANNIATLKSMGVDDEEYIRKVLRQTSNDMEVRVDKGVDIMGVALWVG